MGGAAKDITFEISDPIEDSSGYVISDLPYLKEGIPLLGSGERIRCLWDHIDRLMASLREKGLHEGIAVKVNYKDLQEQLTQRSGARCVPRGARRVLLLLCARSLRLPGSAAPLARRAEPLAPIQRLPYDDQWSSSLPFDWLTLVTNPLGRRWHLFLAGHQITELQGHNPPVVRGRAGHRCPCSRHAGRSGILRS